MNSPEGFSPGCVYIAGAGPGDVELLTLKARRLIEQADLILYAGSLVNPDVLAFARPDAEKVSTARMKLDEQLGRMVAAARAGKVVARLHTGDPSIYGSIFEQIQGLEQAGIPYQVIPGVSSAFAAAAALGLEYTLPGVTQTLMLTRMGGQTPVPERERLRDLASHHTSLAIFLSTGLAASVVDELIEAGYTAETPAAVVYRASWPDQRIVRGTLASLPGQLEEAELTHQSLIIVSPGLAGGETGPSHLYGLYQAEDFSRSGTAILTLTGPGAALGRRLTTLLPEAHLFIPERFAQPGDGSNIHAFHESIRQVLQDVFQRYQSLVCILASGIVMRDLAPVLKNKHSDPAVVLMDPEGRYAVSLLSGHEGGANDLARQLATLTGGNAVITTASDNRGLPALDVMALQKGWKLHTHSDLAGVMSALVNGDPVNLIIDTGLAAPAELAEVPWAGRYSKWEDALASGAERVVWLTCQEIPADFWKAIPHSAVYQLPNLVIGVGCNRGTASEEILDAIRTTLAQNNLSMGSVFCLATVTEKADEPGIAAACQSQCWDLQIFDHEQIQAVDPGQNVSEAAVKALGVWGVAEPCALLASGTDHLLVQKQKFTNVTVAVAFQEDL